MKIKYECLPCIVNSTIREATQLTDSPEVERKIISYGMKLLSEITYQETAPFVSRKIHNFVKEATGIADPYEETKKRYNQIAEEICSHFELAKKIDESQDPLATACNIAIAGNIIDFSVYGEVKQCDLEKTIEDSLVNPLDEAIISDLRIAIKDAKKILVLCDNAGEIVFDKLLIEQLPKERVIYVVKGGPLVNDATMVDAKAVGMEQLVKVMDNGCDGQGTILPLCSPEFLKEFDEADLIISKGQANFETLNHLKDKPIYYLLKAKCLQIANVIQCPQGTSVIMN